MHADRLSEIGSVCPKVVDPCIQFHRNSTADTFSRWRVDNFFLFAFNCTLHFAIMPEHILPPGGRMGKNQYWALCGNPGQVVKIWNKSLNALLGWMYTIHRSTSTKKQVYFLNHPSLKHIRHFICKFIVSKPFVFCTHSTSKRSNETIGLFLA